MRRRWYIFVVLGLLVIIACLIAFRNRTTTVPISPPIVGPADARKMPTVVPPAELPQPVEPPLVEIEDPNSARLVWECKTGGGPDFFSEILPAGEMLVGIRDGAICCLESRTGKLVWKYPENGEGWRTFGTSLPTPQLIGIIGDEVVAPLPYVLQDDGAGCIAFSLKDGKITRRHTVGKGYMYDPVPGISNRAASTLYETATPPRKMTVKVVDLQRWRDVASFTLPGLASKMRVEPVKIREQAALLLRLLQPTGTESAGENRQVFSGDHAALLADLRKRLASTDAILRAGALKALAQAPDSVIASLSAELKALPTEQERATGAKLLEEARKRQELIEDAK
jgi:hypothetical protein